MKYSRGYKYQLEEDFSVTLPRVLWPDEEIDTAFITVSTTGVMTIRRGYAWNGASGPVRDRRATKIASLVHDALYQLMRMELMPQGLRLPADEFFGELCRMGGVWAWLSRWYVLGLAQLGGPSADPANRRKVYEV